MAFYDPVVDAWARVPAWAEPWVLALAFAVATYVAYRIVREIAERTLDGSPHVEDTLESFLLALITTGGWILVVLAFLGGLGVDATALLGGVAVVGFVVGFALKDTLNNLAAGVIILLNQPFRVGESIGVKGFEGTVTGLGIAMTRLRTWDGRYVTIPNGAIMGEGILNFTRNGTRRVEPKISVAYDDNVDDAVRAMMRALDEDARVLRDPAPSVLVTGLGESSVDLVVYAWIDTTRESFLEVRSDLTKALKKSVEDAGCSIPFPQRDLHVKYVPGGDAAPGPSRS